MELTLTSPEISHNRQSFDYGLEGLRGLAAIWVAYSHVVHYEKQLDPTYHPAENPLFFLHAAHASVLIFFILSGYVIGLTNTSSFSFPRVKQYLFRRVFRLFPIYVISILISGLVSPYDSIATIVSNLFFLQNLTSPTLSGNIVLWTLNYEVFYYLIFLLVWCYRPNILFLILGSLAIGLIGWLVPSFPQIISGYAVGWIFWLAGLWISWNVPQAENKKKVPLLSYLCLLIASNHLGMGLVVLNGLGLKNPNALFINLSDLSLFPICFLLISFITQRYFPAIKWMQRLSFLLPSFNIILLLLIGRLGENISWSTSALLVVAAFCSLKIFVSPDWLSPISYLGSISYGIYIFHMPIMHLVHDWLPFNGSLSTFLLRAVIWLILTISLSHFLERHIQPKIKLWSKRHKLT
jgi:peptidoglycan/LPS O-acetylase OafA/YrhL